MQASKDNPKTEPKPGKRKYIGKSKDNPALVAREIIENQIKKKKLVNVTQAMENVGYARQTARKTQASITRKPSYIAVMNNFEESLKRKTAMSLDSIKEADLKKATLRDKTYTFDILNKNYNLATGKPTNINAGIGVVLHRIQSETEERKSKQM